MSWLMPSEIATIACTSVLILVYLFLFHQYRQKYLAIWTWGWFIFLLRYVFELWILLVQKPAILTIANQICSLTSGLLLLWGTYIFLNKTMPRAWLYFFSLQISWIFISTLTNLGFTSLTLPTFLFLAAIFTWTGVVFIRSREIGGGAKTITGGAFVLWGLHKADYPFLALST